MNSWRYIKAFLRKKLQNKTGALIFIIIVVVVVIVKVTTPKHETDELIRPIDANTKTILLWNDFFGAKHFGVSLGSESFAGCKVNNCELWDRLDSEPDLPYEQYDAVIFHGIDTGSSSIDDLPSRRRPKQRYIFLLQESPAMRPHFYNLKNFFNWTATYRRDSDFQLIFVKVKRKNMAPPRDPNKDPNSWQEPTFQHIDDIVPKAFTNKSKQVVWFVSNSNTQSERHLYVNQLAKYIGVDVYGQGRSLTCSRANTKCDDMLDTTYKFYLAFENSICRDYVTEKFSRSLNHFIVPVVYGGADYKLYAPPMSYINVQDFASPRALARYLHYLDRHPEEYQKYFWWKEFYKQDSGYMWCNLCEKLHDPNAPSKVYPDMEAWWNYPGVCLTPREHFTAGKR